ncbi:MAG: hypothetical protein GDA43_05480 [Hormoscilla sp. SP5CHS1]|nr:hypothetical protein [Hormoscilla sp. SP12CHS1]MBC6452711.1 hypothetical protein [Hormoscilla sp. SP5CHS1]
MTGEPNPFISVIQSPTDSNGDSYLETVLKLNFEDLDKARFLVEYDAEPSGWTVTIGDSVSNNGWGGDGGHTSNAAEMQIFDTRIDVYSNVLPGYQNVTTDGHLYLLRVPDIFSSGSTVVLEVSDEHLAWDNQSGAAGELDSEYLYNLSCYL